LNFFFNGIKKIEKSFEKLREWTEKKIEHLLGKKLKTIDRDIFMIILLPGRPINQIKYENDTHLYFGGPLEIFNLLEDILLKSIFQGYNF